MPQINTLCADRLINATVSLTVHNGGSARGYQQLSAWSAIPITTGQRSGQAVPRLSEP